MSDKRELREEELNEVNAGIKIFPDDPDGKIRKTIIDLLNKVKKKKPVKEETSD